MPERSLADRLDQLIEQMLRERELPASKDRSLAPLIELAGDLRDLPRPEFRARLGNDLRSRATMSTTAVQPIPVGFHTVTPYVTLRQAAEMIDFVKRAFGAEVLHTGTGSAGGLHAEVRIGDSMIMMGQTRGDWKPMPCGVYLYVENVDEIYPKALAAGGKSQSEPKTQFYGDRVCDVIDPAGNHWWIGTHVEDVTSEEMARRQASMAAH